MVNALAELKAQVAVRLEAVESLTPDQVAAAFVGALLDVLAAAPGGEGEYTPEEIARARRMYIGRLENLGDTDLIAWVQILVTALEEAGHE